MSLYHISDVRFQYLIDTNCYLIADLSTVENNKYSIKTYTKTHPAQNNRTNLTFNSARISGVPLPDAHIRNTNPNFSLYRAFHSTNSCPKKNQLHVAFAKLQIQKSKKKNASKNQLKKGPEQWNQQQQLAQWSALPCSI